MAEQDAETRPLKLNLGPQLDKWTKIFALMKLIS